MHVKHWSHIYMENTQCAETNGKSILIFSFWDMFDFVEIFFRFSGAPPSWAPLFRRVFTLQRCLHPQAVDASGFNHANKVLRHSVNVYRTSHANGWNRSRDLFHPFAWYVWYTFTLCRGTLLAGCRVSRKKIFTANLAIFEHFFLCETLGNWGDPLGPCVKRGYVDTPPPQKWASIHKRCARSNKTSAFEFLLPKM